MVAVGTWTQGCWRASDESERYGGQVRVREDAAGPRRLTRLPMRLVLSPARLRGRCGLLDLNGQGNRKIDAHDRCFARLQVRKKR